MQKFRLAAKTMFEDVQYVTDEEGNRSHAIIPLAQYEEMIATPTTAEGEAGRAFPPDSKQVLALMADALGVNLAN